jgi:hypothetical protein
LGIGRGERCRRLGVAVAARTYMPTVRVLASPFSFTGGGKLTCSYEFPVVVTPICSSAHKVHKNCGFVVIQEVQQGKLKRYPCLILSNLQVIKINT